MPNVYIGARFWVFVFLLFVAVLAGTICGRLAAAHLNQHSQPANQPQYSSETRLAANASKFLIFSRVCDSSGPVPRASFSVL
jgi:hypothetical protein